MTPQKASGYTPSTGGDWKHHVGKELVVSDVIAGEFDHILKCKELIL